MVDVPVSGNSMSGRRLSAVRTRESGKDLGPPPDGGFQAWSQVALAHFVMPEKVPIKNNKKIWILPTQEISDGGCPSVWE
jgi:hypothetical protein